MAAKKADDALEGAHHFLLAALKVAPAKDYPRRPFHGGGPAIKIDSHAYVHAALWLADRAAPYVDPRDRETFDAWVDLARRQLALGQGDTTNRGALRGADAKAVSRIPCKLGVWAAHEAANWSFRSIYAGGAARPAAANWARFLLKKSPADLPKFLIELDAYCIHLDLLTRLNDTSQSPSAPITSTLWRGHRDNKVLYYLMRLETKDRFGLFYKEKTRWQLTEGSRDDVLATVAEDHFEAAVRAALSKIR